MSALSTKMSTRSSNAAKHPGIPDQKKKKRSPAEMAALRAKEQTAQDAKAAAELAAPLIIAGVEDSMAAADKDDEENAAWPVPMNITRVPRPIRRTHTFADLRQDDASDRVEGVHEGQLSVESFCSFLNTWPGEESSSGNAADESIEVEEFESDYMTTDANIIPPVDEHFIGAQAEFFEEPVKKVRKGRGEVRALIMSKRNSARPNKDSDSHDDVVMGEPEPDSDDETTKKRKRARPKSK
jgi:hypothetical protein